MKIACIYLRVSTDEQDIAHQADIKAKLKSGLIYPKYILTVNSTHITLFNQAFNKHRLVDVTRNVVVVKMCQWGSACHSENLGIDTHQTPLQKPVNARRNL